MNFREWISVFSGEDITILKRSDKSFQTRFAFVGAIVLVIFLLCFSSCLYAVYSFFGNNLLLAIPIAMFFGWMVTNIYLLLLYTLTPNLLIENEGRTALISLLLRLGFIVLLSLIISQPLSVFAFRNWLEKDVAQRKVELMGKYSLNAESLLINQEKEALNKYIQNLHLIGYQIDSANPIFKKVLEDSRYLSNASIINNQFENLPNKLISKKSREDLAANMFTLAARNYQSDTSFLSQMDNIQFNSINSKIDSIDFQLSQRLANLLKTKAISYEKLDTILEHNSFFIYKVKTITWLYPWSWILDFGVLVLFLLPVRWKYAERKLTRYYAQRKRIERQMVIDEYETFKYNYNLALKNVTGLDLYFYETYEDPPFNTQKKSERLQLKSQEDLLKKLYAVD